MYAVLLIIMIFVIMMMMLLAKLSSLHAFPDTFYKIPQCLPCNMITDSGKLCIVPGKLLERCCGADLQSLVSWLAESQ